MKHPLTTLLILTLAACGSSGTQGKTGADLKSAVGGKKSALTSSKPANATKVTAPPKAIPAMISAGTMMIAAPDPVSGDSDGGDEAWDFMEIDVDDDGDADTGDVLLDDESGALFVWWSGAVDLDGDGSDDSYEAFVWMDDAGGVGFVLSVAGGGVLACDDASSADSCVVCDGVECVAVSEADDYDDEDSFEEDDELFGEDLEGEGDL